MAKAVKSQSGDSLDAVPSEMEIVDTFTRLIFGAGSVLSPREQAILATLYTVDCHAAQRDSEDDLQEVGAYLRALGVSEMIRLVGKVRSHYLPLAQTGSHASTGRSARF